MTRLASANRVISAGVPMVIEYWPPALAEAGMLEPLNRIIGTRFARMMDLYRDDGPVPTSSVSLFADRYRDGQTDLLLLPT